MSPADAKAHPFVWWFTRGRANWLSVPCFLFLVYFLGATLWVTLIHTLGMVKVCFAVWGVGAALGAFLLSAFPCGFMVYFAVLPMTAVPPIYEDLKLRWGRVLGVVGANLLLVLSLGCSSGLVRLSGSAIGWVADRNPDAAYRVGVTGSRPPTFLAPP